MKLVENSPFFKGWNNPIYLGSLRSLPWISPFPNEENLPRLRPREIPRTTKRFLPMASSSAETTFTSTSQKWDLEKHQWLKINYLYIYVGSKPYSPLENNGLKEWMVNLWDGGPIREINWQVLSTVQEWISTTCVPISDRKKHIHN